MLENRILLSAPSDISSSIKLYLIAEEYEITVADTDSSLTDELSNYDYRLALVHIEHITDSFMSKAREAGVPVIFIANGELSESDIDELYLCGCADYVTIPINRHILQARIGNLMDLISDEFQMNQAKDYLYDFATAVSHDIKNQFTVSARLSEWLLDSRHDNIDEDSKAILRCLANICNRTHGILDAIEDRTVNESRHRGGFVRHKHKD